MLKLVKNDPNHVGFPNATTRSRTDRRFLWGTFAYRLVSKFNMTLGSKIMKASCLAAILFAAIVSCCGRAASEEPQSVSVCDLSENQAAYNHKLIQVAGFISHDFEDFTLFDPTCRSLSIWVEYGGKRKSDTVYCCGPTAGKSRPNNLTVEGIALPLVDDGTFETFDREVQPPFRSGGFGSVVHAKLIGRFFAGHQETGQNGQKWWAGYGHMGCCSLFVIQQVLAVTPQDRNDLDYGASPDQPDIDKVGCGYRFLTPIEPGANALSAQRAAEADTSTDAFDDPGAVASTFMRATLKLSATTTLSLREKRRGPGRIVYVSGNAKAAPKFMVVVSKPAWLILYARNPQKIAWIVTAAYELSCERTNSVKRIR